MARDKESTATWGDVIRIYKKLTERIDESFDHANAGDDTQSQFWNEHETKIARHNRRLRRIEERLDTLEGVVDDE